MYLEAAEVGKRYRVTWDDCCVAGSFEAVLTAKNYVPDPPEPEPFLDSATFGNGVTFTSFGGVLEEITPAEQGPAEDPLAVRERELARLRIRARWGDDALGFPEQSATEPGTAAPGAPSGRP